MRLRGGVDKPAHLIITLLFGFASDSVFDKFNQSTNSETAMLSIRWRWKEFENGYMGIIDAGIKIVLFGKGIQYEI